MKNKLTALFAIAAVFAASAASCGNDEPEDSTVPDLPSLTTSSEEETAPTENKEEQTEKLITVSTESADKDEKTTETQSADSDKEEPDENSSDPEQGNQPAANDSEPEPDPEPAPTPDPEPDPEPVQQNIVFSYDTLGGDAGNIISSLGTPIDVQTAPACFTNGADSKIYTYDGIKIECYVLDGAEKVCGITISGGNYATSAGIKIGSSKTDVEAAYGAGDDNGYDIIYSNGNSDMIFTYSYDSVTYIEFYMPV